MLYLHGKHDRFPPAAWKEKSTVDYPAELVILAMGFTGPDKAARCNL